MEIEMERKKREHNCSVIKLIFVTEVNSKCKCKVSLNDLTKNGTVNSLACRVITIKLRRPISLICRAVNFTYSYPRYT